MSTLADLIPGEPCGKALQWLAGYSDAHEAIDACPRIDWMEWLIEEIGGPTEAEYSRVRAPALAEYERVRDAVLAEIERVRAGARAELERIRAAAWAEYGRVYDAARAEYGRVRAASARGVLHAWVEQL